MLVFSSMMMTKKGLLNLMDRCLDQVLFSEGVVPEYSVTFSLMLRTALCMAWKGQTEETI